MHFVTSVEYVSDYKLRLEFENGSMRLVDLAAELDGEVFEPSKDRHVFQTARLNPDLDTVVRSNVADMSPETIRSFRPSCSRAALSARLLARDD